MKKLLLILVTILTVASVQAQNRNTPGITENNLRTGDTVTICVENNNKVRTYLTLNDRNQFITHTEPNDNSLWRIVYCEYQVFDWGNQNTYQFQHLKTGLYLRVNAQSLQRATLELTDAANSVATFCQNNPSGESGVYEQRRLHYYYTQGNNNASFVITINNNAWTLTPNLDPDSNRDDNRNKNTYIEKWTKHSEASFNAYFSPENYDFKLAKTNDEAEAQTKQIRLVFDLVDESYVQCKRSNVTDKKLLVESKSESDLNVLASKGITPTFQWKSSKTATSTLTKSNYTATAEQKQFVSKMWEVLPSVFEPSHYEDYQRIFEGLLSISEMDMNENPKTILLVNELLHILISDAYL